MSSRNSSALLWFGILIKLFLIFAVQPESIAKWYAPFVYLSLPSHSIDPWSVWLSQGGDVVAFPYGYMMWLLFLPLFGLAALIGFPIEVAYGITILLVDLSVLFLLSKMYQDKKDKVILFYWLSPIVIVASYVLGYNDLVPIAFLISSLLCLRNMKMVLTGLLFTAAISAKLSMIVALPFFLIYFRNNRTIKHLLPQFAYGLLLGGILLIFPFVAISDSGLTMLFSTPEINKIYDLSISVGNRGKLYVVPLVYLLLLYATWRVRRLNYYLFNAMFGLAFLLFVLATPSSLGWFIWVVPLLIGYQLDGDKYAVGLVGAFSVTYALFGLLKLDFLSSEIFNLLPSFIGDTQRISSLLLTLIVAIGIMLAVRIRREAVKRNDYFRLSRKPFVLGVAGDSGSGKDTYAEGIKGLFGAHSVTSLSGDDYHLWDRQKPMWQVMTHLNPMANDLEGFANDVIALTDGKSISTRHYDHSIGKMTKPVKVNSNDFIVISGLHALYLPILRKCYNLSVYLDIDEDLRRFFKLKRDIQARGHTTEKVLTSLDRREPDSEKFIRPQKWEADLILSLQPVNRNMLNECDENHPIRFKLQVGSKNGLNEQSLARVLIGVCGLHVDIITNSDTSYLELTIEGETSSQDIEMAAHMICPRVFEFLDIQPKWEDGVLGLMQLVTLSHINQAFTKRFL
ncbi:hypothetical protein LZS97_18070 [Vibrio fluvialis]|uniref:hypothetical protein n=1 Tax=Vibrio fluvialis TaxID=676 RepID=UPI001F38E80D|nr:hypothetical protein [Vibrio fluvialis]MCE7612104.1 hypothetical protein [Vibrio fluvialis]MCE7618269.1 hypothetical protein [Vibrio fluvialis]MCE7628706.1 hypothetical protein [Vibrio fluvialis]